MGPRIGSLLGLAAAVLAAWSGPASADAIDGDWCFKDGRNLTIAGPKIRTPGGLTIAGDYDRHAFRYVVPAGEAGAGDRVVMLLMSEEMLRRWEAVDASGQTQGEGAVWYRCNLKVSATARTPGPV